MDKTKSVKIIIFDNSSYTGPLLSGQIGRIPNTTFQLHKSIAEFDPSHLSETDRIIILNHRAEDAEPFIFLQQVRLRYPSTHTVVLASPGAPLKAMQAFQAARSAIDHVFSKPIDLIELETFLTSNVIEILRQGKLRSDHQNILRFFPAGALRRIFSTQTPGSADFIQVTVMFTDIRDSSRRITKENPRSYFTKLNAILSEQSSLIRRHTGMVIKTTGDGLLAVFEGAGRCHIALKCAQAIQKKSSPDAMEVGIGLSDGLVLAGLLGSEEHLHFDVIGAHVHLAARLCSKANPGEILATEEVATKARLKYAVQDIQETIQVRGFDSPMRCVRIYSQL